MAKRHQIATLLLLSAGCLSMPALTDADGYPLVGNVMAKGTPKPRPNPKPGTPRLLEDESQPGGTPAERRA